MTICIDFNSIDAVHKEYVIKISVIVYLITFNIHFFTIPIQLHASFLLVKTMLEDNFLSAPLSFFVLPLKNFKSCSFQCR